MTLYKNYIILQAHRIKMIVKALITFFQRSPCIIRIYIYVLVNYTHCAFGGHFDLGGYLLSFRSHFMFFCPLLFLSPRQSSLLLKTEPNDRFGDLCDGCGIERKKWRSGRHAEAVKNYSGCARIRAVLG